MMKYELDHGFELDKYGVVYDWEVIGDGEVESSACVLYFEGEKGGKLKIVLSRDQMGGLLETVLCALLEVDGTKKYTVVELVDGVLGEEC